MIERDQRLQPHLVVEQVVGQCLEQRRVRRWIGLAEVVDRLDDSPSHQVKPDAIGQVPGELTIVPGQPTGQLIERAAPGRQSTKGGACRGVGVIGTRVRGCTTGGELAR